MKSESEKIVPIESQLSPARQRREADLCSDLRASNESVALLITRDRVSQEWAPRWLRQAGLDVMVAVTREQASAFLADRQPTIVIADTQFLGGNKAPLLDEIRQATPCDIPIIALCEDNRDLAAAGELDITDVVRRPFEWNLISRRIAEAVRAQQARTELRLVRARLDEINIEVTAAASARAKNAGMDALTKLPNIERFRSLLHKATSGREANERPLCLLAIGLDRFRMVNEAVGYQNANQLLSEFADRLRKCLRSRDVIGDIHNGSVMAIAARLSGARFALLVSHGDAGQIERVSHAITRELEQPFEVAGQSIYLTASIGAATYPRGCSNVDDLLRNAETAMLEAQQLGSGFRFHSDIGASGSHEMLALEVLLREAVRDKQLTLAYQPITDAESGEVVAAEALLRWSHPTQGMISPATFIPIAESTGLMQGIGDFVIRAACRQLRLWIDAGMQPIRMAINLSLCQLLRGDIVSTVERALLDNDLPPQLVELELSERGVLNERKEIVDVVRKLKSLGLRISVDDFGTGHAAIGYLKDFPIDVIKIDRSYVSGEHRNKRDEAIASGMVALAQRLDATVVAEGVETREQLRMLRNWGAQECQGFLFSAALSGEEFRTRFS